METEAMRIEVNARVWKSKGSLNQVHIIQTRETEEFIVHDNTVSSLGSYPSSSLPQPLISLDLQNLRPNYVFQHLRNRLHDPLLPRLVSDKILLKAQGRDLSQRPLFMIISVILTQKEYLVVPSSVSAAPSTVTDSNCAICLEDMSESETKPLCQMPHCVHLFHENCVIKWLDRSQNSCPLCRQAVENLD